jgi:hypothetical protein
MDNGTVIKANEEDQVLLLVAYDPNTIPHRGMDGFRDVVSPRVLEKACWKFAENGAKVTLFHKGIEHECHMVENYVFRPDEPWVVKDEVTGEPTGAVIRKGCWLVAVKCDDPTWALYKSDQIGGGSPEGACRRIPPRRETLARIASMAA